MLRLRGSWEQGGKESHPQSGGWEGMGGKGGPVTLELEIMNSRGGLSERQQEEGQPRGREQHEQGW